MGAGALLNAGGALGASRRPAGAAAAGAAAPKTTMVAAQRVAAAAGLNIDVPGFRSEVIINCYPGLVDIDLPGDYEEARQLLATKGPTVLPMLARSWKISKSGKIWTFELRPNCKSPAGNTMQAFDVQWSADKWTLGSRFVSGFLARLAGLTKGAEQVKALTPLRVRFFLNDVPPPFFLSLLSIPFAAVYDSTEIRKHITASDRWGDAWLRNNIAGFGAYTVTANSPTGDQQTFEANAGYWNIANQPKIKKVTRLAIPESSTRLQLLLANQADLADELTPVQQDTVAKSKNHQVTVFATARTMFIAMNNSISPFENPTIRKGIAYAVPYADILKFVYRGRAKPWKTVIVPYLPGATDKYWKINTNLSVAKNLLKDIQNVPLTLSYPIGSPADEQTAILVQQGLRAAGLNVSLEGLDGSVYNVRKNTGLLNFYTNAQDTPIVADPAYDLNRYFLTKALQPTIIKYKYTPEMDALMDQANKAQTVEALLPILDKIQSILVPQVPLIPIAWTGNQVAHVKTLTNFKAHSYTFEYYTDLFFKS